MKRCLHVIIIVLYSCFSVTTKAQPNQTVTNGSATALAVFPGSGCLYNWVNSNPAIGLPASGSGNIPSFMATNNGNTPVTATITATPVPGSVAYIGYSAVGPISVVNTQTNTVISTIQLGILPTSLALSPDRTKVYVANLMSYTISVVSTASNVQIASIPIPISSGGLMAVSPDGSRLYMTNYNLNNVTVINTTNYATVATIPVGLRPGGIAISPDGLTAYISNAESGTVSIINTISNTVTSTVNLSIGMPNTISQVALAPDGSRLYVTNAAARKMCVVNTANNSVVATIPFSSDVSDIVLSPDGSKLYISDRTSNINVFSTATNGFTAILSLPAVVGTNGLSISPDGTRLFAVNMVSNRLITINTLNNTIISNMVVNPPTQTGNGPGGIVTIEGAGCAIASFNITVNPTPVTPPTITTSGTFATLNTTYGTASPSTQFTVSGANITGGILVTPPPGFEVSLDNTIFSNTVNVSGSGTVGPATVYIRLSKLANAATYSGNVMLTSAGALPALSPVITGTVRRVLLNLYGFVNKPYGSSASSFTAYYDTPGFTFKDPGFKNGESFNSLTFSFIAGTSLTDPAGVYRGAVIVSDLTGKDGYLPENYTVTYSPGDLTIVAAQITLTANNVSKVFGTTLTNVTGSTAYTVSGMQNGETIGSINISYGQGAAATDPVGTYAGSVKASAPAGGTFAPTNYSITYVPGNLIVTEAASLSATSPQRVVTEYGTASTSSMFTVSGTRLSTGITVTAPSGFEVSADNITFRPAVTAGSGSMVTNLPVYIRLTSITNAGDYTGNIMLSSGGATFSVAMPNSTVTKVSLTIAAIDVTKPYGDILTDFTGTGVYKLVSGTLKNGNTLNTVTIIYGKGGTADTDIGTYIGSVVPLAVTGNDGFLIDNYQITPIAADIIIKPVAITISANAVSKTYGTTLTSGPMSTGFSVTGLKNLQAITGVNVSYLTGSTATSPTGKYANSVTITSPTGATFTPNNYIISYTDGDIMVNPAPLTITADNKSKPYGLPIPAFTATYAGFVNGEDESVLTKFPTLTTTAMPSSRAGRYPINAAGASAANYSFTYVSGVLTVDPPPPLVIPNTFTPNGDGTNDVWNIKNIEIYPKCAIEIFNRYGEKVFTSIGYPVAWDGTYKSLNVPVGTYYYLIDLKDGNKPVAGSITILR